MTKIKICGLTREQDALYCAEKGADYLGFIFVPSTPRFIEPERAAGITAKIREREQRPRLVGVFRDASIDYMREIASLAGLDAVQLHGTETDEDIRAIGLPAIKTFRVGDTLPDTTSHPSAEWFLFDTFDERRIGGTGRRFDWSLLNVYPREKPFFVSGGLTPSSVAAAVSLVRPDGIDISSGLEAEPGIKDLAKVDELFRRVKRA
jgi:phosphoribosylanthranilate isomerase